MKIGLLSDIHCNVEALEHALALLDDCDEVICAGDLLFQYRFSSETLELLRRREVRSIVGNHDKTILHTPQHPLRKSASVDPHWLEYLASLPGQLRLTYGGTRLLVAHGAPWDDPDRIEATYVYPTDARRMGRMREIDADIVILGHTHVPVAQREGSVLVVNPGSCGVPDGPSGTLMCAALDVDTGAVAFRPFQTQQNGSLRKER